MVDRRFSCCLAGYSAVMRYDVRDEYFEAWRRFRAQRLFFTTKFFGFGRANCHFSEK